MKGERLNVMLVLNHHFARVNQYLRCKSQIYFQKIFEFVLSRLTLYFLSICAQKNSHEWFMVVVCDLVDSLFLILSNKKKFVIYIHKRVVRVAAL